MSPAASFQNQPAIDTCAIGTPGSLSYRVMFTSDSASLISPWHDIPLCSPRIGFSCVCTTPAGSWVKYCLADEPLDPLRVQRDVNSPVLRTLSLSTSSHLSSSPHTSNLQCSITSVSSLPSGYSKTAPAGAPSQTNPFFQSDHSSAYTSYTSTALLTSSSIDSQSSVSSPFTRRGSLSRVSGSSWTTFSSFSTSFSEDDAEKSRRESVDLAAFNVIGRPAHYTENSAWHCGFLPQTSIHTIQYQPQRSPRTNDKSTKSFDKNISIDSCEKTTQTTPSLRSPPELRNSEHQTPTKVTNGKSNSLHPTIQIPVPEFSSNLDNSAGRDPNRPLDVMEIGCCKERSPGEVYDVKPLAAFVWKPNGGTTEVPSAVVVMALDNPMETLLEDGNDVENLMPGMLEKMRVWLEKQQSLNAEGAGGIATATSIRLETSILWTTAAISKCHLAWQRQYENAILLTPPSSLPFLDKSMLTCLWDTYTHGSSSYIAHVAIPLSQPRISPETNDEHRFFISARPGRERRVSLNIDQVAESSPRSDSIGHIAGAVVPLSHPKGASKAKGESGPLRRSLTERRGRPKEDFVIEVDSLSRSGPIARAASLVPEAECPPMNTCQPRLLMSSKSCREQSGKFNNITLIKDDSMGFNGTASTSPAKHSSFSLSTLKTYLPHASWVGKGKRSESQTKTPRSARMANGSPVVLSGSTTPEKTGCWAPEEGTATRRTTSAERRMAEITRRTSEGAEGNTRRMHTRRSSASDFDFVARVTWADAIIGVEAE